MSHLKAWRGTGTVRRTIWAGGCETSLSQGDSFSRRREQEQYKSMPRKKRKFSRRYQASTRTEEHHPGSIGLAGVNSGSQYAKALSCADRNVARRSANPFLSARLTSYPNRKSHAAHNAHQSCELCVYRWLVSHAFGFIQFFMHQARFCSVGSVLPTCFPRAEGGTRSVLIPCCQWLAVQRRFPFLEHVSNSVGLTA